MSALAGQFRALKSAGRKFATLTAYDYSLGRILDGLGLDFILVGDSVGMIQLGHPDTTQVTLEEMAHHVKAVAAGVTKTLLVADLPRGSYTTPGQARASAEHLSRMGAGAVKIEGGTEVIPQIRAILDSDIPVLGHLGMLPQRVREEGGYRIKGRKPEEAALLIEDARALDSAGAFGIVLELVTPPVAALVTQTVSIPTIGIGSGPDCDGQILVTHDLLGLFPWFRPRFVTPKADLAAEITRAVTEYIRDCRPNPTDNTGS